MKMTGFYYYQIWILVVFSTFSLCLSSSVGQHLIRWSVKYRQLRMFDQLDGSPHAASAPKKLHCASILKIWSPMFLGSNPSAAPRPSSTRPVPLPTAHYWPRRPPCPRRPPGARSSPHPFVCCSREIVVHCQIVAKQSHNQHNRVRDQVLRIL